MSRKLSIEEVGTIFAQSDAKVIGNYISNKHPIEFICRCGNIHKSSTDNVRKRGANCLQCVSFKRSDSQKISEKELTDFIISKNYKIINLNYKNVCDKINLICPKGHSVSVSIRSFRQNAGRCRQCFYEQNVGQFHVRFVHGRSQQDRYNRNKCRVEHNKWKKELLKKYNFSCYICKKVEGNKLCAHHLNGYNWDINNRYNVENGVILCKYHHNLFHKLYGKGDNTKGQFDEFCQKYKKM